MANQKAAPSQARHLTTKVRWTNEQYILVPVRSEVVRLVGRRVGIHGGCIVASQHSVGPLAA
jgi:hypothetical protein